NSKGYLYHGRLQGNINVSNKVLPDTTGALVLDGSANIWGSFSQCSCPLISRQELYLKLTLPADVDILAESDNPTHYADGFHCNAR
uniref:hypothetical protein n=1 Tax=Escherichia albertii TaxID=208962 RepID=UPI0011F03B96